ncbi:DUF1697 domain-containing protein [Dyadobacter sp. 676]|uniref:DUF1697 domain-containing protein n=1 Tax=Dyadobacter sp. 676 TaxID=3088362 RepID=A0AAU8FNW5_9BACT
MPNETYIAILRGVNVGSTQVKMAVLQKIFEDAGYEKVQTYIQSGNVLFDTRRTDTLKLARDVEALLRSELKAEIPVLVLDTGALREIHESNPFIVGRNEDIGKLHVTFLAEQPETSRLDKLERDKYLPDEFLPGEKAIYLFCPNGYGRTKLHNNFFESKLKVTATTRNWKTVTELLRLAAGR